MQQAANHPTTEAESLLSTANLVAMKSASPLYRAEMNGLKREIARRQRAGLDVAALQTRLAVSEQRLTQYNSEIALASKVGEVPDGSMAIHGVVTKNGAPVEGLVVSAYDLNGQAIEPATTTDHAGSFVLIIRQPTSVRLVVSTASLQVLRCHDVVFVFEEGAQRRTKIDLETTEPVPVNPVYPCGHEGEGEETTSVPELIGMTRDQADQRLADSGLSGSYDSAESEATEGTVIHQDPIAGAVVNLGTRVNATLAIPRTARVPDVRNDTEAAAKGKLEPTFQVEVLPTRDGETPGRVVRQFPTAGTRVELPATVTLLVRQQEEEPKLLEVPKVVGLHYREAQNAITERGFTLGPVTLEVSDAEAERVLSQDPEGGSTRPEGSPVALTVSVPKEQEQADERVLPDVTGQLAEEGANAVRKSGFNNVTLTYRNSDRNSGTILSQSPPGNRAYASTVRVTLVVAQKPNLPLVDPFEPNPTNPVRR